MLSAFPKPAPAKSSPVEDQEAMSGLSSGRTAQIKAQGIDDDHRHARQRINRAVVHFWYLKIKPTPDIHAQDACAAVADDCIRRHTGSI